MPRQSRIVVPQIAHHITQRGNYRQKIFHGARDFEEYSHWLNEYAAIYGLKILAYCLMSNHVHFIAIPNNKESISRVFNTVHMRYAQYVNRKLQVRGHLWQGRFYSCLLDDTHLYRAIRYVERNPVRAKIVKTAWEYKWSSAKEHAENERGIIKLDGLERISEIGDWKEYLGADDQEIDKEIRLKTSRGLVVGEEKFIGELEKKLKRSLKCLNPGRPWKSENKGRCPL